MPAPAVIADRRRAARPGAGRPMLGSALALLIGVPLVTLAADPEMAVSLYQQLIEVAPGEFAVRGLSLSAATGPGANAAVITISDPQGQIRMGFTAAAAGAEVNTGSLTQGTVPEGWTVETQVGQSVSYPE